MSRFTRRCHHCGSTSPAHWMPNGRCSDCTPPDPVPLVPPKAARASLSDKHGREINGRNLTHTGVRIFIDDRVITELVKKRAHPNQGIGAVAAEILGTWAKRQTG
jgi:hypothetical protein